MENKLKSKVKDQVIKLQFKAACRRVEKQQARINDVRMRVLRRCLTVLEKCGVPVSNEEKEIVAEMISLYDETIQDLSKEVDKFRWCVENHDKESC